jgi:hypothetical protein
MFRAFFVFNQVLRDFYVHFSYICENTKAMRTFLALFSCFLFLNATAQIRLSDQTDGQPVAFAHLLTDDGRLAATSDINGFVDTTYLRGNNHISIQQIAYQTLELSSAELRSATVVKLQRRIITLPEVIVGKASKEKMYLVLKGYFRGHHLEDGTPKYYTDGIGEYYIEPDGKGVRFRMLEYRTFRNETQIAKAKKRTVMVVIGLACTPYFRSGKLLTDRLGDEYSLSTTKSGADILKKKVKVGFARINQSSEFVQANVDVLAPRKEKDFKLFNYTCRIVGNEQTEVYRTNDLKQLTFDNLESFTQSRRVLFKHKTDPAETDNTGINEFYVYEARMVPKSMLKGIKFSGYGLRHSHDYSNNYWEELSKYHIPPLSRNIEDALGKTLTMY